MPGCVEKKGKGQVCVMIASEKQCYLKLRKQDTLLHASNLLESYFLIVLLKQIKYDGRW